jgi:hypothetical protein
MMMMRTINDSRSTRGSEAQMCSAVNQREVEASEVEVATHKIRSPQCCTFWQALFNVGLQKFFFLHLGDDCFTTKVNMADNTTTTTTRKKKSLFAARLAKERSANITAVDNAASPLPSSLTSSSTSWPPTTSTGKTSVTTSSSSSESPLQNTVSVLSDVAEKKIGTIEAPRIAQPTGFPKVEQVDHSKLNREHAVSFYDEDDDSSYAQHSSNHQPNFELSQQHQPNDQLSSLRAEIHEENMEKLMSMSLDEIAQAQAEIMATFSGSILDSLRKRAAEKYGGSSATATSESMPSDEAYFVSNGNEIENDVVKQSTSKSPTKKSVSFSNINAENVYEPGSAILGGNDSNDTGNDDAVNDDDDDDFETKKLEWTLPVSINPAKLSSSSESTSSESLRFDLHGNIMNDSISIPTYAGLHHHGDEPERAGYTITELGSLSRSTVSSQRAVSIRALAFIIAHLREGRYSSTNKSSSMSLKAGKAESPEEIKIFRELEKANILAYLRLSVDDTNLNVISAGLDALSACTGSVHLSFGSWRDLHNLSQSSTRNRIYLSPKELQHFQNKTGGYYQANSDSADDHNKDLFDESVDFASIEDVTMAFTSDIVAGLKKSLLLERFRYFLKMELLEPADFLKVLAILSTFAKYSPKFASAIAEMPQTAELIHALFVSIAWPCDSPVKIQLAIAAVSLFTELMQTSKMAARRIADIGVVDSVIRFISVDLDGLESSIMDLSFGLQIATFNLLSAYFHHGLSLRIFHEYRTTFSEIALSSVRYYRTITTGTLTTSPDKLKRKQRIVPYFWKAMLSMLTSFPKDLGLGEFDDYMLPFVPLALDLVKLIILSQRATMTHSSESSAPYELSTLTTTLLFVGAYGKHVSNTSSAGLSLTDKLVKFAKEDGEKLQALAMTKLENVSVGSLKLIEGLEGSTERLFGSGVPVTEEALACLAEINLFTEFVEAVIELRSVIRHLVFTPETQTLIPLDLSKILTSLNSLDECSTIISRNAVLRTLGRGFNSLRAAAVFEALHYREKYATTLNQVQNILKASFIYLTSCSEGDNSQITQILDQIIFGFAFSESVIAFSSVATSPAASFKDIVQFYKDNVFAGDSEANDEFDNSNALFPHDWIFAPLYYARKLDQHEQSTSADTFDLIKDALQFILYMDSIVPLEKVVSLASAYVHTSQIFMLPPLKDDLEVFQDDLIRPLLRQMLSAITRSCKPLQDLEVICGGNGAKFYKMYQDFLGQFTSVSMGDMLFAQYAVIPLSTVHPADYRALFWNEVLEVLPGLSLPLELAPLDLVWFTKPIEKEENIKSAYLRLLHRKGIQGNSGDMDLFYEIAAYHLIGFLFVDMENESVERKNSVLRDRIVKFLTDSKCDEALLRTFFSRGTSNDGVEKRMMYFHKISWQKIGSEASDRNRT